MAQQKYESHPHPRESDQSSASGGELNTWAAVTREQRQNMIAEAAYYMAEHRQFEGGDPFNDWVQAQRAIDSRIKGASR
ncbi:MAG: putative methyl-accepting chemotaxis protein [Gammaproteobacteria bacterium]|nr:MAG: putative methyl-accepting chemotaxis protein [Gammaproteobacteria bacterium]